MVPGILLRSLNRLLRQRRSSGIGEVISAVGDGFVTIDDDWTITFVNPRGAELVQSQVNDLVGRTLWEALPEARETEFEEVYLRAKKTGETQSLTAFYRPLNRWFQLGVHPMPDGLAAYFRDVTPERERDERLQLLESALDRIEDIVLITQARPIDGPNGPRIVYVNSAFERMAGYRQDEVIGRTPRILQGPRTQRVALDNLRAGLERFETTRTELINYKKSGEAFWLEIEVAPIADTDGRFTHFVAVQRDVTDRKRKEAELIEREERFRLLSGMSNDVIWDWNVDSGRFWISRHPTILGHEVDAAMLSPYQLLDYAAEDQRVWVRQEFSNALAGGGGTWQATVRVDRGHGTKTVDLRAVILRDEAGRAVRVVGGATDVTDLQEMGEQLQQAQKLEAIGQLTGGVAHDFNNLLTIILGNVDELAEMGIGDAERRRIRSIEKAAERGADLIGGLLAFSRRQPLEPRPTDVNALIESSRDLFRQAAKGAIALTYNLSKQPALVLVDPSGLQTAILNLVLNAAQAIDGHGTISISTEVVKERPAGNTPMLHGAGSVIIAVADNGCGMSEEEVSKAFEPFFSSREGGTGLGLSTVYGFVKQSRGDASIESEKGSGTTVRIVLPHGDAQAESPETPDRETGPPPGHGERVLVVEDDEEILRNVAGQVRALGYDVVVAASGEEALRILEGESGIDLLFTDMVLPGGPGGEAIARTGRSRHPSLKVLFTTGFATDRHGAEGQVSRGRLLAKPYRRGQLARALREALED